MVNNTPTQNTKKTTHVFLHSMFPIFQGLRITKPPPTMQVAGSITIYNIFRVIAACTVLAIKWLYDDAIGQKFFTYIPIQLRVALAYPKHLSALENVIYFQYLRGCMPFSVDK
jgi:hypothetical protein